MQNETHTITTTVDEQAGYILIRFNGDLVSDTVSLFKTELSHASETIRKFHDEKGVQVHILLDMTNFTGNYALDALSALVNFARDNKPYVKKTASFGGSDKVKMAGEIAIVLSGRDNIKVFERRDDAIAWLME